MAQYLSADLRIRVTGAVEAGCRGIAAARQVRVNIASAVRWMDGSAHRPGQRRSRAGATAALGSDRGAGGAFDAGDRRDARTSPWQSCASG